MKRIAGMLVGMVLSSAALAMCEGVTPEKDGIGCKVAHIDGTGNTLLIRVHVKKGDADDRVATAKIATRRAIDSFLAQGGVFIKMRTTRPDGVEVARTCSKIKGKKTEHCGDWAPVKG